MVSCIPNCPSRNASFLAVHADQPDDHWSIVPTLPYWNRGWCRFIHVVGHANHNIELVFPWVEVGAALVDLGVCDEDGVVDVIQDAFAGTSLAIGRSQLTSMLFVLGRQLADSGLGGVQAALPEAVGAWCRSTVFGRPCSPTSQPARLRRPLERREIYKGRGWSTSANGASGPGGGLGAWGGPFEVPQRDSSPDRCYGNRLVTVLIGPAVVSSTSSHRSPCGQSGSGEQQPGAAECACLSPNP